MNLLRTFKMAIKNLKDNKVRTFLTMLGIIIGVATYITLVSLGEGTKKNINDSIQSMGTNLITVSITGRNSNRNITYDDIVKFVDDNNQDVDAIAPVVSGSVTLKYENKSWDTSVTGTTPEFETVRNTETQRGRFITQTDVDFRQKVVIVGTAVINNLFSQGMDPIDQTIKINGDPYKIVGILQEKNSGQNYSSDDQIIMPLSSAQRLLRNGTIRNFYIQAVSPDRVDAANMKIQTLLLKIYKDENTYRVQNQADMLSQVSNITGTITTFLAFIAGISLVVGGIGIMNIMLVSVTERTREIGIRKAIGAKRRHILMQFLVESTILSCIGGIIGILLGFLVSTGLSKIGSISTFVSPYSIGVSFTVSAIVGIFFGIYPANKASKLNPIQALRYE